MAMHPFHRTELLVGAAGIERLGAARVAVIGLGGVGSYAAEALSRSCIGHLTLVDFDRVCITNLNRQLHATRRTVNQSKAELMGERARSIDPKADVRVIAKFFGKDSADEILAPVDGRGFDFVLDCIDNMTAKVHLLESCVLRGIPVISAMGAGGRMDPTRVRLSDLSETTIDPFARLVRDLLRQRGITTGIDCVWSDEPPNDLDGAAQAAFRCICPGKDENTVHGCESRHQVQGSVAWMPAIYGLTMAGLAVNRLVGRTIAPYRPATPVQRDAPYPNKPSRARKQELLRQAGLREPGGAEALTEVD
jgi:tRNA A37 threonylcarbamoyladenosine dehydratase